MSEQRRSLPGAGLIKGLAVTARTMTRRSVTRQYPDEAPSLPPRSRGVIALFEENCTSCMLCARECPDWCIYIDSHKETIPAPPGGRERTRNVLDRFAIDFSLCMYCGICIEVCPFDALFWSPEFEYSEFDIKDLLHEKDRLRDWMWTVPAPPALDAGAEEPKEIAAARRAAEKAARAAASEPAESAPGTTAPGTTAPGTSTRPRPATPSPPAGPGGAEPGKAEPGAAAGPDRAGPGKAEPGESGQAGAGESETGESGVAGPPGAGEASEGPSASGPGDGDGGGA